MSERFDYVIVGAGSAGCVLANRLTEDPEITVLLIETGPKDNSWELQMPAAFSRPLNSERFNWAYKTLHEPYADNRRLDCPRGKVLGGSSSINGMCYVRGNALDYDRWAEETGYPEWSYAHCLPYFIKSETRKAGGDAYHGDSGPLVVTTPAADNPLFKAFIEAGVQAGYGATTDQNGYRQEGFGTMDMTVNEGVRWSTANAYLKPVMSRNNLHVQHRTFATRIVFDKNRAVGVEIFQQNKVRTVRCEREVILCGGVVNSVQLLHLSGVGPAEDLEEINVPIVVNLPGVGQNLQDHLEVYVQHACKEPISLYPALKIHKQAMVLLQWLFTKKGWGTSNHFEAGGFIRTQAGVDHPDIQFHFLPVAANYDGRAPAKGHGFQAHMGPMRPTSRGYVKTVSADPKAKPEILFNYLQTDQDQREFRDGLKLTREIFAQKALDPYRGEELAPGPSVQSDSEIDAFIRAKCESAYHPSCTCKMGIDNMAVVDSSGRVHGTEQLRVVDASIMPSIISGNLNATVIMMAEKLADQIRGNKPLPPSDAPVYRAVEWRTNQRESVPERAPA